MEREKTDTKGRITDGVNEEWRRLGKKRQKKHLFTVEQNMQCPKLTLAR